MLAAHRHACFAGVALLLAGCSGVADTSADRLRQQEPEAVDVELMQYRHDEVNRVLVVKVANPSDEDTLTVEGLEVDLPGFEGGGRSDVTANIPPGRVFDLRVPYGDPVCAAEPAGKAVVLLGDPESEEPRRIVSPEGEELLARIRARECSVAKALEATPVRWSPSWRQVGGGDALVVRGTLLVGPVAGGHQVDLVDIDGSVLFSTRPMGLPVAIGQGESRQVPVRIQPQRCDPHAMADNSKGFEFQVRLRLGTGSTDSQDEVLVPVLPDRAGKNILTDSWLERCGFDDLSQR